jgi:LytR cell envelope-related transcriptional attenuator
MVEVFALSLSSEIEKYGAYAGFAAIPGLAILALLYFAQAREVKRLREWAGRAPERAQELQDRVIAQAQQAAQTPAAAPAPARRVVAQPLGAGTAAAKAAPAGAVGAEAASPAPVRQTAAPSAGEPSSAPPSAAPAPGPAKPGGPAPAAPAKPGPPAAPSPAAPAKPGAPAPVPAAASAGAAAPPTTPRPGAPAPARPAAPATAAAGAPAAPPRPAAQRTEVRRPASAPLRRSSPSATVPPRAPADRRGGPPDGRDSRRPVLIGTGILAGLVLVVLLATQVLGGGDDPAERPNTLGSPQASAPSAPGAPAPVNRADVTVSVLNGTTVPGLAAQVGDQLQSAGFARGQVTNAADQQRAETTVQYGPQHRAAALEAAEILKVPRSRVRPLDANTQAIAGPDADVVVTVGADRTQ